jgi:hypothetical protein
MYSSTCFGRPHARHQELNNCSSSLWFYRWSVVVAVLLVVVGPFGPTTNNSTATTTSKEDVGKGNTVPAVPNVQKTKQKSLQDRDLPPSPVQVLNL